MGGNVQRGPSYITPQVYHALDNLSMLTPLYAPHNDTGHQVLWAGHERLAAEQETYIIKLHEIRLASKPGGVVDMDTILHQ